MHRVWPNSGLPGQLAQDLRTVAHMEQAVTLVEPQQLARSLPTGPDPGPILGSIEQALDSGIDHILSAPDRRPLDGFVEFWSNEIRPQLV